MAVLEYNERSGLNYFKDQINFARLEERALSIWREGRQIIRKSNGKKQTLIDIDDIVRANQVISEPLNRFVPMQPSVPIFAYIGNEFVEIAEGPMLRPLNANDAPRDGMLGVYKNPREEFPRGVILLNVAFLEDGYLLTTLAEERIHAAQHLTQILALSIPPFREAQAQSIVSRLFKELYSSDADQFEGAYIAQLNQQGVDAISAYVHMARFYDRPVSKQIPFMLKMPLIGVPRPSLSELLKQAVETEEQLLGPQIYGDCDALLKLCEGEIQV